MRPQLATFVFYALLLALLGWCFRGWEGKRWLPRIDGPTSGEFPEYSSRRMRCLWLAPLLFFVWANSHGGFVAGYCIFSAYLILRGVEVLAARGATVIVNSFHSRELGEQTVAEIIAAGGSALHLWGSVANPQQVDAIFDDIEQQIGDAT